MADVLLNIVTNEILAVITWLAEIDNSTVGWNKKSPRFIVLS